MKQNYIQRTVTVRHPYNPKDYTSVTKAGEAVTKVTEKFETLAKDGLPENVQVEVSTIEMVSK